MKLIVKTLQGNKLPIEIAETDTVQSLAIFYKVYVTIDRIFEIEN